MYKCDFCADSLDKGGVPVCATACPQKATVFLPLTQAIAHLRQIVGKRYVYGLNENGGTATWYVSSVSFEAIETAHLKTKQSVANDGRPGFAPVASKLQESSDWALATLAAPAAALAVAYVVARRKKFVTKIIRMKRDGKGISSKSSQSSRALGNRFFLFRFDRYGDSSDARS